MAHDPSKVPAGPAGEWFYNAKDGTPITDEQYDEMKFRFLAANAPLPWEPPKEGQE